MKVLKKIAVSEGAVCEWCKRFENRNQNVEGQRNGGQM